MSSKLEVAKPEAVPVDEPADDEALLAAFARTGAEAPFRTLVERHSAWVYGAAFRQLREAHAAEDATQAAFILLYQRAKKLKREQKVAGWLFITVQYTVRSMMRARHRRQIHEAKAALEREATRETPPLAEELDAAVERLGAADRAAILLRFYGGMEYAEVAQGLGISEIAARKRVTRAVARLRGKLGPAMTEEGLASAAAFGIPAAPAFLSANVAGAAFAAGSGSAISGSITAALKGAAYFMAMTKAKIVIVTLFVAAALSVVTTIAVRELTTVRVAPLPAANEAAPDAAPAGPATFEQTYGLREGEVLRHIPPPFGPERATFFIRENPSLAGQFPDGPARMTIRWENGKAGIITWTSGNMYGYDANDILQRFLDIYPPQVEGDKSLLSRRIPGDLSVRGGATADQLRAALEQLFTQEFGAPLRFALRDVERRVIVLKGPWNPAREGFIEFYGRDLNARGREESNNGGTPAQFAGALGSFIDQVVVVEAEQFPASGIQWALNLTGDGTPESRAQAHNRDLVLKHIAEQTGLTWSEETRKVRGLSVVLRDWSPEFEAVYGLSGADAIRRVTPVPELREQFFCKAGNPNGTPPQIGPAMIVQWRGGRPIPWGMGNGYRIKNLIDMSQCLGVRLWEVEGDATVMNTLVPGDFVVNRDASEEEFRASIEKIAGEISGKKVRLVFREVERPVTVLKGDWHYAPVEERKADAEKSPVLELYAADLTRPFARGQEGEGTLAETGRSVSDFIEKRVVIECHGGPAQLWVQRNDPYTEDPVKRAQLHDPELVIRHLEEQTGLKASQEMRKVRVLFVESGN